MRRPAARTPTAAAEPGGAAGWYLAFAEWRADIQRRTDAWRTVKFFRRSRSHTILWTLVMAGHYRGVPPGVTAGLAALPCARMTARKILADAVARGYFRLEPAPGDSRRKRIVPSDRCRAEYEAMVDEFLHLADRLRSRVPRTAAGRREASKL